MSERRVSLELPHLYAPWDHQLPFWRAMSAGARRAALVWHRRAGKDTTAWNWMIWSAVQRVGTYFYFAPTYAQGKKIIWDGLNNDGAPFLAHVPAELIGSRNETDMQLVLTNGSILQIVGTDKIDSIRGTNPVGVVFSEYAVGRPDAWKVVEPVLLANGGWAVFVYTPLGKNHGHRLYEHARTDPAWFSSFLTIRDTRRPDGHPVISEAEVARLVSSGMLDQETADQEYYCSFFGAIAGAYYAEAMREAETSGRLTEVPWEPALPVATWWDLGMDDSTTIWFVQQHGRALRFIDYVEDSGEGFPHYAKLLKDRPYVYTHHVMPHDVGVREIGTGEPRVRSAQKLGIRPVLIAPKWRLEDGINACRQLIPRSWFDARRCARGVDALRQYRKEWSEEMGTYRRTPRHDEWSHGADAYRTGAQAGREVASSEPLTRIADYQFNPLTYDADNARATLGQRVRVDAAFDLFAS